MTNFDDFLKSICSSVTKLDSIIESLKKLEKELVEEREDKLRLKTSGTVLGTVGTAGTVTAAALAPFTAGLSLVVAAGIGVTASVAGGATNIISDYAYKKAQEVHLEQLKDFVSQLEKIGKQLDDKLGIYEACLNYLAKENYDQETAHSISLDSLKENVLSLVESTQLFLYGSIIKNTPKVRLSNSKQAMHDLSACQGIIVKDILRNRIVMDLDRNRKVLIAEPGFETFLEINLTALSGTLGMIKVYDSLEKSVSSAIAAGKFGVTSSAQILKTVEISAKEAASFGSAGASASSAALKTGTKTGMSTAGKVLSVATVGVSVVLTAYEIGSLIKEFNEKDVLTEEVRKIINFCQQKQQELSALSETMKKQSDDDDEACKCKNIRLKVLYFNSRSMNSDYAYAQEKMRKIRELLFLHRPNIVAVCETWLNNTHEDNEIEGLLSMTGYSIFRQDRGADHDSSMFRHLSGSDRRGGGLLVAFRTIESKFSFSRFNHLDYKDNLMNFLGSYKYLCNKCVRRNTSPFKFGFILAYRPPGLSSSEDKMLVEVMNDNCDKIMNGHDAFAMVGDFNCEKVSTLGFSKYYNTSFPSTHIGGRGLDQVVYYDSRFVTDAHVVDGVSDHSAIVFNLNFGKDYIPSRPCKAKRCT